VIRFLLDENVPHAIAHGLRLRGVEVITATDAGLLSVDDEHVARYALQEQLVIFTQDADFLRLHARGVPHPGIIYSKQGKRKLGEIIQFLKLLAECLDEDDMANQVERF